MNWLEIWQMRDQVIWKKYRECMMVHEEYQYFKWGHPISYKKILVHYEYPLISKFKIVNIDHNFFLKATLSEMS